VTIWRLLEQRWARREIKVVVARGGGGGELVLALDGRVRGAEARWWAAGEERAVVCWGADCAERRSGEGMGLGPHLGAHGSCWTREGSGGGRRVGVVGHVTRLPLFTSWSRAEAEATPCLCVVESVC
jgi:hypothetical protein